MGKNSFVLYHDYAEHFALLSDGQLGRLLRALMVYETEGMEPKFEGVLKMAFSFIKANLDRDREKWEVRAEISRKNGASGGRPKVNTAGGEQVAKTRQVIAKPKKPVNVTATVTDIVTGDDTAIVTGKKEKSIKKEKPPKRQYGEFVSLTETEHGTLVDKHGTDAAVRMIEILDNYKGANPVKRYYNSDYRAILSWVVDKYYSALADGVKGAANDAGMLSEIDKAKRRVREGYG